MYYAIYKRTFNIFKGKLHKVVERTTNNRFLISYRWVLIGIQKIKKNYVTSTVLRMKKFDNFYLTLTFTA